MGENLFFPGVDRQIYFKRQRRCDAAFLVFPIGGMQHIL